MKLVKLCQPFPGGLQLLLLICDQQAIGIDLLRYIDDLGVQQRDLLFNIALTVDNALHIGHIGGLLLFQFLQLFGDFRLLGLQFFQFSLQFGGRSLFGADIQGTNGQHHAHNNGKHQQASGG